MGMRVQRVLVFVSSTRSPQRTGNRKAHVRKHPVTACQTMPAVIEKLICNTVVGTGDTSCLPMTLLAMCCCFPDCLWRRGEPYPPLGVGSVLKGGAMLSWRGQCRRRRCQLLHH